MVFDADFEVSEYVFDADFQAGETYLDAPTAIIPNVVAPRATVTKVGKVSTLSVTDVDGTTTTNINDGDDGFSPSASVQKVGSKSTITITDKTGTTTAEVNDGEKGDPGEGIAPGGTTGQFLKKKSATNYDTEWMTVSIPTKTSDITNDSGFITKNVDDLTNYTKSSDLAEVATSGDYEDLENKPSIPTKTSDITNDSGYITKDVNNLTNYTKSSDLAEVATSGEYDDLSGKPDLTLKEDKSNKVSVLNNSSTNTQYPGAKVVYDSIEDVREVAAGKNTNYSIHLSNNPAFNTQNASISVTSIVDIDGVTINAAAFKKNDNILVTDINVPDRWVASLTTVGSVTTAVLYILETAKAPVQDVQNDGVSVVTNGVADISGKVDKEAGKGLSTNDYDATEKQKVADAYSAKHSHSNKGVLDDITAALVSAWNTAYNWVSTNGTNVLNHLSDSVKHITASERNTWNSKQPAGNYMTLDTDQTSTSKKTLSYTEPVVRGGQDTILNILSTHTTDEITEPIWTGRMKIGNKNKTFLLGVYAQTMLSQPPICGIGAHSWSDSFAEEDAAWEDIYLNPDGDKAVYIGDHDWRSNTGWFKVQNTGTDYNGKTYCNRGSIQSPTWREVATVNDNSTYSTNETWSSGKLNTQFGYKENSSNKVTSISSGSTNTQYPSAKLLYDQLLLKQNNLTVNPATTSANLTSIGINGTNYALAGGTQVIWRTH